MSYTKSLFSVTFLTFIYFCDAGKVLIDFPEKCPMSDSECHKNMLISLFKKYSESGIEKLGIPRVDPYVLKNATVSVLGMVDFIMTDGLVEGATKCSLQKFETNVEERYTSSESFCESFKISGHYKTVVGPLAQLLLGNTMSADGNGLIQIDKMTLKLKIPFTAEKHEDGEMYLVPKVSQAEYSTNDIENIRFEAENVLFGGQDISKQLINFMNNNWMMINRSFGKFFSDKVMETFYDYLLKFFQEIPASEYMSDDLTSFARRY